jgi:hypothetical protein
LAFNAAESDLAETFEKERPALLKAADERIEAAAATFLAAIEALSEGRAAHVEEKRVGEGTRQSRRQPTRPGCLRRSQLTRSMRPSRKRSRPGRKRTDLPQSGRTLSARSPARRTPARAGTARATALRRT